MAELTPNPAAGGVPDDLASLLAEQMKDPEFAAAYAAAERRHAVAVARALLGERWTMAESLTVVLAATLAEHAAVDIVGTDPEDDMVAWWQCPCGAKGMPKRVEPFSAVLGEARSHQATMLGQTVAAWLDERTQHLADTDGANVDPVGFARVSAQVLALEDIIDEIHAEVHR